MGHRNIGRGQNGIRYGFSLNDRGNATLNLFEGGTFTRASEASYLIAAPTDGSTPFLAWATTNQRRIEDRGDGFGPLLLMEGSRTNLILRNQDFSNASWVTGTGVSVTVDQSLSPDGTLAADRVQSISGNPGATQTITVVSGTNYSITVFQRAVSGTPSAQLAIAQSAITASVLPLASVWARAELKRTSDATSAALLLSDARNWSAVGGLAAGDRDGYLWCPQIEAATFPTSPIRTVTSTVTRASDVLTYAVGQYPESFMTKGFRVDIIPDFNNVEASGINFYIISTQSGSIPVLINQNGVFTYDDAGNLKTSVICTYSRGTKLTVTVEPSGGRLTVEGALTGNGTSTVTPWILSSSAMRVGDRYITAAPFYGRIGPKIIGL